MLYPPHYIAVSAIYLACLTSSPQVALPLDPAPWWELFDVPSEEAIHDVLRMLLDMYARWTGDTAWIGQQGKEGMSERQSIWKKAAQLNLPLTKESVRQSLTPR